MRFGWISPDFQAEHPSAIGIATRALAEAVVERGHEAVVFTAGESQVLPSGIEVVGWGQSWGGRLGEWADRLRVRRMIGRFHRRRRIDGLEVPDFQGWLPWGVPSLPVHVRLHSSATVLRGHQGLPTAWSMRHWEARTLRQARRTLAAHECAIAAAAQAFGFAPNRPLSLPCPVTVTPPDPAAPPTYPAGRPYALFCGARLRLKGADTFLAAAQGWGADGPELDFVLAGEPGRDPVPLPGSERVVALGRVGRARVHALMAGAVALVAPGRTESQGLAVAEALALGCPVLVPQVEPFTTFYRPDEVAFVEDPEPAAWRARLLRVLADPEGAREQARHGAVRVVKQFEIGYIAHKWIDSWKTFSDNSGDW